MGTSYYLYYTFLLSADHPHACGDKFQEMFYVDTRKGSSPRVWGQVLDQQACYDSHGIIPTRVGTRLTDLIRFLLTEDHPHACGDKTIMKEKLLDLLGSSPRVWGQASIRTILMNFLRIIPTRVGTSWEAPTRRIRKEDHPHACGDKLTLILSAVLYPGSSPRVWGQVSGLKRMKI